MFSLFRSLWVFLLLFPELLRFTRDYRGFVLFGFPREVTSEEHQRRARRLTALIARLGPTFIKAVQVLGMREDLLPKTYTDQFKTLQDQVPPFCPARARKILEAELGRPPEELFDSFETEPLAAASLGQVHRAVYQGRGVAVKIRRPGVERIVRADLAALGFIIRFAGIFVDSYILKNFWSVLGEFRRMILLEMDFRTEARNAERLRRNLRDFPRVIVPRCLEHLTTERVSVFEFHDGVRVDDIERLRRQNMDPDKLVGLLIEVYVHQVVIDGFIHADPHPGNLLVDPEGRLVILDFGMAVELDPAVKKELFGLVVALVRNDVDAIVDGFYRLRMVEPNINTAVLRDAARTLMSIQLGTEYSPRLIQEICQDIYAAFHKFPLRLPQSLVYLLRASALVEGIGISFDPRFNGVKVARPIIKRMVAGTLHQFDRSPADWVLDRLKQFKTTWDDVNKLIWRAEREQLHVRIHQADLSDLERYYTAMIRRALWGLTAIGIALLGGLIYVRTGVLPWLLGGAGLGGLLLLLCLLLPLRRQIRFGNETDK